MSDSESNPKSAGDTMAYAEVVSFIPKTPAEAAKSLVYIGLTAAALISSASSDGFSAAELVSIIVAIIGLIPVFLFSGDVVKGVAAFLTAGLQAVGVTVVGGIEGFGSLTPNDWVGVAITAFAAIGVIVTPNAPWSGGRVLPKSTEVSVDADGLTTLR